MTESVFRRERVQNVRALRCDWTGRLFSTTAIFQASSELGPPRPDAQILEGPLATGAVEVFSRAQGGSVSELVSLCRYAVALVGPRRKVVVHARLVLGVVDT